MKKTFKWVALGLCALSLMASCKKKSSGEPVNPNNNENTKTPFKPGAPSNPETPPSMPVDKTKGIKLVLAEGQTTFSIAGLAGESISIEGLETSAKTVAGWEYSTKTENYTAPTAGAVVTIRGNVKALTISAGSFASLDLSGAPQTLDTLQVEGAEIKQIDLSGAKSLRKLYLKNTNTEATVDLTGNANLETLYFFNMDKFVAKLPSSIKELRLEETDALGNAIIDVATFPKLEKLLLIGSGGLGKPVNMSGSTTLTTFVNSRSNVTSLDLSNCPALVNVMLRDMNGGTSVVNLSNCPKLAPATKNPEALDNFSGFYTGINSRSLTTLNLSGCRFHQVKMLAILTNLVNLDLSDNRIKNADFSKFTALKSLNLLNNTTLIGTALTNALNTLPATGGTIKIANLNESDAAIVTSKGWTISTN